MASRKMKGRVSKTKTRGGYLRHVDDVSFDFRRQLDAIHNTAISLADELKTTGVSGDESAARDILSAGNILEIARNSGPKGVEKTSGKVKALFERALATVSRKNVANQIRRLIRSFNKFKDKLRTALLIIARILRAVFKTIDAFQSFKSALSEVEKKEATGFLKTATDWVEKKQSGLGSSGTSKAFSKMLTGANNFMKVCANDDAYNYLDDMLDYSSRLVALEPILVDNDHKRKLMQQQGIYRVVYRTKPGENIHTINAQTGGVMGTGTLSPETTSAYLQQIMLRDGIRKRRRRHDKGVADYRGEMETIRKKFRSSQAELAKNGESSDVINGMQKLSSEFENSLTGGGGFFVSKSARIANAISDLIAKAKERASAITMEDVKRTIVRARNGIAKACRMAARAVAHTFHILGSLSKYIDRLVAKGAVSIQGQEKKKAGYYQVSTWGNLDSTKEALNSVEQIGANWLEKKRVSLENKGKSDRTKAAFSKVANAAKIALATGTDKVASECLIDFLEASARVIEAEPILTDLDARYMSLDRVDIDAIGRYNSRIIVSPTNYEENQVSMTKSINARIFDGVKIINSLLDEMKKEIHNASIRYPNDTKVENGQSLFTKYSWKAYMVFADRLKRTRQNFKSYMSGNYTPHCLFHMFDEADRKAKDILGRIERQGGRMSRKELLRPLEDFKLDPTKFVIA